VNIAMQNAVGKKTYVFASVTLFFIFVQLAEAQRSRKISRIGILFTTTPALTAHLLAVFKDSMRKLGNVEGHNFIIEPRYAETKDEQVPLLAAELVRLKVDVIVASTNTAIEAVRQATQTIPIVMPNATEPVEAGFVDSLARPGGNITGLSAYPPEVNGKRIELLREIVPRLSRVALLWNPDAPGSVLNLKETDAAARFYRLSIQSLEARNSPSLDSALQAMTTERSDALIVFPGQPLLYAKRGQIAQLTSKIRLPAIYPLVEYVEVGGLMSYGTNLITTWRRAATYVDSILKGAKAAELPVERPMRADFVINLKAAKEIGLTIPPEVLIRADRVIR
jgi:putative tryptophan/tyrosine transport system substrate-binding protein